MGIARITADRSRLLFAMLDSGREGAIGHDDFQLLCNLLQVRFKSADTATWITRACPTFWNQPFFTHLENIVRHRGFDLLIDFLLIFNAVILVIEEWDILSGAASEYDATKNAWARSLEIFFTCVFTIEMVSMHTTRARIATARPPTALVCTLLTVARVGIVGACYR